MTRYARIENEVVMEFIETDEDITTLYPPTLVWVVCGPEIQEGWRCVDAAFALPPPPPDRRPELWEEFRMRRDLYLARLGEIAGRYDRRGDTNVPVAADAIVDGLLAMPQDAALLAQPDADSLRTAIVVAAGNLLKAQLANPATAPGIKAALDKVFK